MANNPQLATDTFASGSLKANWSTVSGATNPTITGGFVAQASALSTNSGVIWTSGPVFPADQVSEMTVAAITNELNTFIELLLRYQTGSNSGYQVVFSNSTLRIVKQVSGTPTDLITTVTSVTLAAGDVLSAVAAGGIISVYRNWKQIAWAADATYSSGSPGFLLFTSVNVAHAQVASWRGYSTVQQDGVWQKQGSIIFPIIAGDIGAGGGFGPTNISPILHEGNAQILSGTVYKTWISVGQAPGNIWYAESLDAKTWTRSAAAVLANYITPWVLRLDANTLVMYAQNSSAGGAGSNPIDRLTSTDNGQTWTLANAAVLSKSGSGNETNLWNLIIVDIIGNTWYALYSSQGPNPPAQQFTNLATSTDGGITWVKSGSNPVISSAYTAFVAKINGTYYNWINRSVGTNKGQNAYGVDPNETVRWKSTDLVTWVKDCKSFHITQMFESINGLWGQSYPNYIMDVGGQAYAYLSASVCDNNSGPPNFTQTQRWQQQLAIAPVPMAQLVTQPEDAMVQNASDAFTNGPGDLSGNWTTPTGATKLTIVSGNKVQPSAGSNALCAMVYTGKSFLNNQYSEATIATDVDSASFIMPIVRAATGTLTFYEVVVVKGALNALNSNSLGIFKCVNGAETQIGLSVATNWLAGDKVRFSVVDDPVTGVPLLTVYQNDFIINQVQDYSIAITSGSPGLKMVAVTAANAQVSSFAAGNAGVIPYTGGSSGFGGSGRGKPFRFKF